MKLPACGNHKKECGYRTIYKTCKKPKKFKCKEIILPKDIFIANLEKVNKDLPEGLKP